MIIRWMSRLERGIRHAYKVLSVSEISLFAIQRNSKLAD